MKTRFERLGLLVLVLLAAAGGQNPPRDEAEDSGSYRIAVAVDLVVLRATVRDRRGNLVPDLRRENFQVFEDGAPQPVRLLQYEDFPVTVGLVVDHSGSMRTKLAGVAAGARAFVQAGKPEDEAFVVNFNENVALGLPAETPFSGRSSELEAAISNAPATGMTALYDAVALGLRQLELGRHDKKALLVISDGGDNASALRMADVLALAERSRAVIYTIGLAGDTDPDRDPATLKRLSRASGGEAHFPDEIGEVVQVCEAIAHEIRNQYTIGFVPTNAARDGGYRSIRVVAQAAGRGTLNVRTRAGYVAPKATGPGSRRNDAP